MDVGFNFSHSLQQLRARKGGARGGKAGFATLSAFPLADFLRFEKQKKYHIYNNNNNNFPKLFITKAKYPPPEEAAS
jgi:hypothetical protein